MKCIFTLTSVLLCLFCYGISTAQTTVSGKVVDAESAEPLIGVNILIEGTASGAVTDYDGNFSIDVPSRNDTLVFSYTGYLVKRVAVSEPGPLVIELRSSAVTLEEVVVIGYGTQKKKLLTGATVNVSGEQLESRNNTNALQALQGQTAGVNITSVTGQPGGGYEVNVRGVGTIGNSNPLFIVDGMPVGDITYLNNADIESIDILKDAASAAIYGSRAANGVVLITTKKGIAGRTRISFDAYYGIQNIDNKLDLLDSREYATVINEQAVNSGQLPVFTNEEIAALPRGTNWLDEIFTENAATQNYSIGVQGGNDNSLYSASLSYTGQEGVIGGADYSNYRRGVFRINSRHEIIDNILSFGENLTFSYIDRVGIPDAGQYFNHIRGALNTHPMIPVYDEEGNFYNNASAQFVDQGTQSNPLANIVYNNQRKGNNQRIIGNVFVELSPWEPLTLRSSFGGLHGNGQSRTYTPPHELSIFTRVDTSSVTQSSNTDLSWNWENTINYNKSLGNSNIDILVGMSAQKWSGSSVSATNANLVFDDIEFAYLNNTTYSSGVRQSVGGSGYEDALLSYFGRAIFNHDDKYLFSATLRADGSAKFAEGNRWGYFPSFSAGWVISNEDFLNVDAIEFLKLRASWGQNGSNFVAGFQYLAPITTANTNYIFGTSEGSLTPGAYPSRLSNTDIHWETSEQLDLGVDAEFVRGKLFVNLDWYRKTTKDWLIQAPILATAGADAPFINGGDVTNTGVELAMGWRNRTSKLSYSVSANFAYNKNEVNDIPTADGTIHGETNELWNNAPEFYRATEGLPIGYFWGYETNGVFQNEAEVANYRNADGGPVMPSALPGDLRIVDVNGDGAITSDDKTIIGDPNPDYIFGFTVTADYAGFDLAISANGVLGNQIVQSYRNVSDQFANYPQTILDRWHGDGSSNTLPRLTSDGRNYSVFSDLYIQDGDFLRINTITLGYDLSRHINSDRLSGVRVYVSGQNLLTLTNYTGMDPEIGYGQNFARGVDIGYYPRPRTWLFGLNVNF